MEEIDFSWRVKKAGYKIMVVPASVIYHKGSSHWNKRQPQKIFLVHRNNLIIILEHLSKRKILWLFPLRIMLDYGSILFYIITGRFEFIFPVIKAQISLYRRLPEIMRKRKQLVYKRNRMQVEKEMKPNSILWDYFISGKKRYSEVIGVSAKKGKTMHYNGFANMSSISNNKEKFGKLVKVLKRYYSLIFI
jgi:hypothetical protein